MRVHKSTIRMLILLIDGLGHARNVVLDSASLERRRFSKIAILNFRALVVLKLLVLLISRLVVCSARISVDRHT